MKGHLYEVVFTASSSAGGRDPISRYFHSIGEALDFCVRLRKMKFHYDLFTWKLLENRLSPVKHPRLQSGFSLLEQLLVLSISAGFVAWLFAFADQIQETPEFQNFLTQNSADSAASVEGGSLYLYERYHHEATQQGN